MSTADILKDGYKTDLTLRERLRLANTSLANEAEAYIAKLESALSASTKAMEDAVTYGNVDHLDCCDDGGKFWYSALRKAKELEKEFHKSN